jgi:hypothetical protein
MGQRELLYCELVHFRREERWVLTHGSLIDFPAPYTSTFFLHPTTMRSLLAGAFGAASPSTTAPLWDFEGFTTGVYDVTAKAWAFLAAASTVGLPKSGRL